MRNLTLSIRILFFFILSFVVLYFSQSVLVPLTLGLLLALLLTPVSRWFEQKGTPKGVSAFLGVFTLILIIAVLAGLLFWQLKGVIKDLSSIEDRFNELLTQVKAFISSTFGISPQKQQQVIKQQQSGGLGKAGSFITGLLDTASGVLVNFILVLIYTFLLIYFRQHFKQFIYKLVKPEQKEQAAEIIQKSGKVTQQYLGGLGLMIVILWIMYSIGFSIVGVKDAIFFAILCGTLELIPFVGNLTGTSITVLMGLAQGGDSSLVIGILITYGLVQFIQSYVIEPLVVGDQVNLNPFFTIFILVVGEAVWGIGGMVMAIPMLGIIKIICDHIEPLKPYGYLLGSGDKQKKDDGESSIKKLFNKITGKASA
ncbi:AI-2E family transporter [Mucilaginibacter koreensis]